MMNVRLLGPLSRRPWPGYLNFDCLSPLAQEVVHLPIQLLQGLFERSEMAVNVRAHLGGCHPTAVLLHDDHLCQLPSTHEGQQFHAGRLRQGTETGGFMAQKVHTWQICGDPVEEPGH